MHYDRALIEKVFSQNHINASLFELFIIASFLILGIFRENDFFVVPAGASILLIFSIILMLISAVFSWLKTWTYVVLILLFLILNQFSKNSDFQQFNNHVYGLNYDVVTEDLNEQLAINMHSDLERAERDKDNYINALNNWKTRTGEDKPKLIIVNTSGGGARSALWTFIVLRQLDSLSNGKFSRQTQMITGASGGMLGAAYFRELMFRSTTDRSIKNQFAQFERNISKDLLNQVSFTITTNDLFYRYQNFDYNGIRYLKDRGYAFEQSFHKNTDFVLEKSLGDYTGPEQQGVIPVMIFSPTIVNDGRRLLISSLPAGYFQLNRLKMNGGYESILENFEYDVLLKPYQPENTRFSSVLRMSATFPYILPMVVLPGNMNFHVMDAGIRDNYGSKTTISFINVFKEWIKENTSGVVVVRIRDLKKNNTGVGKEQMSMIDKLFMPFGNMYGNFPFVQDFDQDENLALTIPNFDFPLDILSFNLRQSLDDKISLSWHLTAFEKDQVRKSFQSPVNEIEINRLLNLIGFNGGDSE
jgi:energy-coupling factor transporter transmembrane protein EcfT